MPVKALSDVETVQVSATRTYSVPSSVVMSVPAGVETRYPSDLQIFLEEENPLGCIRGVMWVMVFNAAAVLLGLAIWKTCTLVF